MASQSDILSLTARLKDEMTPSLQRMARSVREFTGYFAQSQKEGAVLAQKHATALGDLGKSVRTTSDAIKGTLTPAMAGLGIGSVSAAAGIAGLTAGVKSLAETWRDVKFTASEAGVRPETVRQYEAMGKFIGVASGRMDDMLRSSALIQLEMQKGFGTGAVWFHTIGRGMQDARVRINQATDAADYLNKVIEEGNKISDPRLRPSFFESMTGLAELSRLTAEDQQIVIKNLTAIGEHGADLEKLQKSFDLLGLSWQNFSTGIEADFAPALIKLSDSVREWLDGPAKDYLAAAKEWVAANPEVVKGIELAAAAFTGLAVAGGAVSLALGAINLALAPELYGFIALAAAVTAAYEAYQHWDEVKAKASSNAMKGLEGPAALPEGKSAAGLAWGKIKGALGFAEGGIVTKPTIGMIGEAGAEAVIPLDKLGDGKEKATETTSKQMLLAILRLEELWRRSPGGGAAAGAGGGAGIGATPGGGAGGGATPGGRGGGGGGGATPGGGQATPATGTLATNQKEAYKAAVEGGLSDTAAKALVANMSGESLRNPANRHWDATHWSQGIVQWDPTRAAAIKRQFGKEPKDMTVAEQTKAAIWEINTNPAYAETKRALAGGGSATEMIGTLVRNYERPGDKETAIRQRLGFSGGLGNVAAPAASGASGRATPPGATLPAGQTVPGLKELETATADIPGGRKRISSENDLFHHGLAYHSKHVEGLAFDQTLADASRHAQAAEYVRNKIRSAGLSDKDFRVIDEYAHPSHAATGGHIHSEFATAEAAARFRASVGEHPIRGSFSDIAAHGRATPMPPHRPGVPLPPARPSTPLPPSRPSGLGRATPAAHDTPVAGGGGAMAGGGGAGGVCGPMAGAAGALGSKGILGALFGGAGVESMLGGLLSGIKGGAGAGGMLGGLFGAAGGGSTGPLGFLGGALGKAVAGVSQHQVTGAANLDINLRGLPKQTNVASSVEGLFKSMNVTRAPQYPFASHG